MDARVIVSILRGSNVITRARSVRAMEIRLSLDVDVGTLESLQRSIDGASDNEDRADRAIVDVTRAPLGKSAEVH